MQVTGAVLIVKPQAVAGQHAPTVDTQTETHVREPAPPVDQIAINDLARLNLLMPPRDGGKLAQLQEAVFSGRYGPPAVTIAEALIAVAVARGLRI